MPTPKHTFTLKIKVIPNASKNEVCGWVDSVLKIKVKAVPEGGRANKEMLNYLVKQLSIPRRSIRILKGENNRNKTLEIDGFEKDEIMNRLESLLP